MRVRFVVIIAFSFLFLFLTGADIGFSQSSRCVIAEKQGNMVLVTCGGGGTQYVDIGGKADIYKVGDIIDIPSSGNAVGNQGSEGSRPATGRDSIRKR